VNLWLRFRDALSRSLDPAEREAVFGDFVELALTDRQVVKSLVGLVVRRQLGRWRDWTHYFALVAIALPVCALLDKLCSELGQGIWPTVVMWLHHGPAYDTGLTSAAFWLGFCFRVVALSTWSWTSGFALGTMSPRTTWGIGVGFVMNYVLVVASLEAFSVPFWWAWLPLLLNLLFVFLPAYCGILQSTRSRNMNFPGMLLMALWTVTVGGLALWTQVWGQAAMDNWSRGGPALTLSQLVQHADLWKAGIRQLLTTAVMTAPILYVLAIRALAGAKDEFKCELIG
jgi:hypothetical protein